MASTQTNSTQTKPVLGCFSEDAAAIEALDLPVDLAVFSLSEEGLTARLAGAVLPTHRLNLVLSGVLILSKKSAQRHGDLEAAWHRTYGAELPACLDLSAKKSGAATKRRAEILEWLLCEQGRAQGQLAARSVTLMRELAALRVAHDELQRNFAGLEEFTSGHLGRARREVMTLPPIPSGETANLVAGQELCQRLVASTRGLSDIALCFPAAAPETGVLTVTLSADDDEAVLETWHVPGAMVSEGWLSLVLPRALGHDARSCRLTLTWDGEEPLRTCVSHAHPDMRFCLRHGDQLLDQTLAMRAYASLPGTVIDVELNALPADRKTLRKRSVPPRRLAGATNIATMNRDVEFVWPETALQVHVSAEKTQAARLEDCAIPGLKRVEAIVRTRNPNAPDIEYALALFPSNARLKEPGAIPDFAPHGRSEWLRVSPSSPQELVLTLPSPLRYPCDLYLLTRSPADVLNDHFGWSTFRDVSFHY